MINNLKKVSTRYRQKIIEIVCPDKQCKEVLIYKYCDELTRDEIANKLCIEPETLDKRITKARKQFNAFITNEYELYSDEDKKIINLMR